MSHMVIFRNADGKTGYHQAEAIEDAVRFVERLRNHEGVENVRIVKLEEVPFEYRPYFRVEVGGAAPKDEADVATGDVVEADEAKADEAVAEAEAEKPVAEKPVVDPLAAVPTPVPVAVEEGAGANGKRGIFSR